AVANSAAVVHREHDIAAARQIMVDGIGVRVVVHIVPAEKHLPHGASMQEHQRWALVARFGAPWQKQLTMEFETVGGFEQDLQWRYELIGREVARLGIRREGLRF